MLNNHIIDFIILWGVLVTKKSYYLTKILFIDSFIDILCILSLYVRNIESGGKMNNCLKFSQRIIGSTSPITSHKKEKYLLQQYFL